MTKFKPLQDRVALKRIQEYKTAAGIIIPETVRTRNMGEVVAIGSGTSDIAMVLKVGDKVLFDELESKTVNVGGEELIVIGQGDVMGIIE